MPWDRLRAIQVSADARRDLYSIIGPGLIAIAELALMTVPEESASLKGILQSFASATRGLNLGAGIFLGLIVVFLAFVLGSASKWLGWVAADALRRGPYLRLSEIRDALTRAFGEDRVVATLQKHPIWNVLDPGKDEVEPGAGGKTVRGFRKRDPQGRRSGRDFDTYRGHVLQYCKSWLRVRQPLLAVDGIETEINLLYGFPPVIVLAALPMYRWVWVFEYGGGLWIRIFLTVLPVVFAFLILRVGVTRQEDECGIAVRSLLFAEWSSGNPVESSGSGTSSRVGI